MSAPEGISRDPLVLVGTIVERKYRIDRVVAEGGFGIVYAGHHLDLGVPVALKVLRPSLRADPDRFADLLNQFREEASVLSRLRRASVVMVLDSGVSALGDDPHPLPWMALEWLEGETLKDHLEARRGQGGRSRAECMDLLRPVLEAIAEAHELKIVHRDLKPSNIMLVPTKSGVSPRVLDFGIAKMMAPDVEDTSSGETATDSNVRAFTAARAAPEQLSGSRTGPWTDVYALGLLLTEVLTDTPPIASDPNERYRVAFAK
jgi:serine/threonine-protein kinase